MLTRYRIIRGKRPPEEPLPTGRRVDTRKHTKHFLAPLPTMVETLLEDPRDPVRLENFATAYRALLNQRFAADRSTFDQLADDAQTSDIYLGCSCPTKRQPEVRNCHTSLALQFLEEHYPDLAISHPAP